MPSIISDRSPIDRSSPLTITFISPFSTVTSTARFTSCGSACVAVAAVENSFVLVHPPRTMTDPIASVVNIEFISNVLFFKVC